MLDAQHPQFGGHAPDDVQELERRDQRRDVPGRQPARGDAREDGERRGEHEEHREGLGPRVAPKDFYRRSPARQRPPTGSVRGERKTTRCHAVLRRVSFAQAERNIICRGGMVRQQNLGSLVQLLTHVHVFPHLPEPKRDSEHHEKTGGDEAEGRADLRAHLDKVHENAHHSAEDACDSLADHQGLGKAGRDSAGHPKGRALKYRSRRSEEGDAQQGHGKVPLSAPPGVARRTQQEAKQASRQAHA
mmetsp:Transcript_79939/g.222722  ORF Transcript_79939/g.222722 Transcript_79939/m.222722 type:complete len:246 (-) Transcript_79939:367-1104(-)